MDLVYLGLVLLLFLVTIGLAKALDERRREP
jgi:hypothetical protein